MVRFNLPAGHLLSKMMLFAMFCLGQARNRGEASNAEGCQEIYGCSEKSKPLRSATSALHRGDVEEAHRILDRMAQHEGATTLLEMQPAGGHGRALRTLFDALGVALTEAPADRMLWEMLSYCQSLWIDAMLALNSLRVTSPKHVGAMMYIPPSSHTGMSNVGWQDIGLESVELSGDTGILSFALVHAVTLVNPRICGLASSTCNATRVELRVGRKAGRSRCTSTNSTCRTSTKVRILTSVLLRVLACGPRTTSLPGTIVSLMTRCPLRIQLSAPQSTATRGSAPWLTILTNSKALQFASPANPKHAERSEERHIPQRQLVACRMCWIEWSSL